MHKKFNTLLALLFIGISIFSSCKKDLSCEGCRDNNKPPIAVAGPDQVITLPTDSTSLDGSASSDPDGMISSYSWKKISGPASFTILNSAKEKTIVKKLENGTYQFELTVTDDGGLSDKDTMMVTVDATPITNHPPVANAGPEQTITLPASTITLDGSASSDPDNNITTYAWTKISGPSSFSISNARTIQTQVTNLVEGVYQFELTVTDDGGLSEKDTMMVTVDATTIANHPPVANAGPDHSICLPVNTVNLDGGGSADPDNNITKYQWTKISGPLSFNITNTSTVQTQVTDLIEGVYEFELMVTDAFSVDSRDTLKIIVMTCPPPCTGCKIVFVSNRDGNNEIYTCNADGSGILRLTNNTDIDSNPVWSPDGSRIAFISNRSGDRELYIMNADGSNVVRRTFSGAYQSSPTWSPGGDKIAYSKDDGLYSLWVVSATIGSPSFLFHKGDELDPAWSPDGAKIALTELCDCVGTWNDICTINGDGSGFTALTGSDLYDCVDYLRPSWSPDGTKMAMAIRESVNCGGSSRKTTVGIMNYNGTGITTIMSSGVGDITRTSWSADGTKIAYTSVSGNVYNISWVAADGSASGIIVTNGWDADWQH